MRLARVYDSPGQDDGYRVLVDRVWPRGVSKDAAKVDLWVREAGPSTGLRRWFGHDPERFGEFARRYRAELEGNPALGELRRVVAEHPVVTLLYGARDTEHNQAVVLAEVLGA
nr:hypothetical protein DA06_18490 [Georgenia sp. SUBG003]